MGESAQLVQGSMSNIVDEAREDGLATSSL